MVRCSTRGWKVFRLTSALATAFVFCMVIGGHLGAQETPPEEPPAPPAAEPAPPRLTDKPDEQPAEEPVALELSETAKLEGEARVFEGKGLYPQAVATYQKALLKAIELAKTGDGETAKKFWAEAEIYLDRTVSLMYQKASPDYKEMVKFLEDLGKIHNLPPVMDGWRRWELARVLIRTGGIDKEKKRARTSGL